MPKAPSSIASRSIARMLAIAASVAGSSSQPMAPMRSALLATSTAIFTAWPRS